MSKEINCIEKSHDARKEIKKRKKTRGRNTLKESKEELVILHICEIKAITII